MSLLPPILISWKTPRQTAWTDVLWRQGLGQRSKRSFLKMARPQNQSRESSPLCPEQWRKQWSPDSQVAVRVTVTPTRKSHPQGVQATRAWCSSSQGRMNGWMLRTASPNTYLSWWSSLSLKELGFHSAKRHISFVHQKGWGGADGAPTETWSCPETTVVWDVIMWAISSAWWQSWKKKEKGWEVLGTLRRRSTGRTVLYHSLDKHICHPHHKKQWSLYPLITRQKEWTSEMREIEMRFCLGWQAVIGPLKGLVWKGP